MDLNDLFDVGDQPKVKLKGPRRIHIDLAKEPVAVTLNLGPEDCPYGSPEEEPEAQDSDLDVDIATRAKTAAQAHDEFAAAKAAYDTERSRLQKEVDEKLEALHKIMVTAREARTETIGALETTMTKDGITTIPMTDRPDIRLKSSKGSKKGITRKWLVDPENVAVKAYEEALAGNPTITSGKDFAGKVWDAQPKGKDSRTVTVPDAYEDEPDHN